MLETIENKNISRPMKSLGLALLAFSATTMSLFHSVEPNLEASGHNSQIFLVESECWNRLDFLRAQQNTGYWARSATCFFDRSLNNGSGAWIIRHT